MSKTGAAKEAFVISSVAKSTNVLKLGDNNEAVKTIKHI